ncbi:MAG: glycosyltransferase family 2 protein [Mycoplasmatales bacterium]
MLSVLITCYNQKNIIEKTIMSIVKQETSFTYNIIVSDDFSTDGSFEYLKMLESSIGSEKLRIVQPKTKKHVGNNRNTLIANADQKYSIFVDGDDVQQPNFIEGICQNIADDDIYHLQGFNEIWAEKQVFKPTSNYYNIFLNVYKTNVLKQMSFDTEVEIGEDVLFTLENYQLLRKPTNQTINIIYDLNRADENVSLTKNSDYLKRYNRELFLLEKMKKLNSNFPKWILNEKKIDIYNFSLLANQTFDLGKIELTGLGKKHQLSYILLLLLPKKIYKQLIIKKLGHKV